MALAHKMTIEDFDRAVALVRERVVEALAEDRDIEVFLARGIIDITKPAAKWQAFEPGKSFNFKVAIAGDPKRREYMNADDIEGGSAGKIR